MIIERSGIGYYSEKDKIDINGKYTIEAISNILNTSIPHYFNPRE